MTKEIILREMRNGYAWFNNIALDDYAYLLGADMWSVYTVYCRRAMNDTQSTKIAQQIIASHLSISTTTVSNATRAMEWLGLVEVERRHRSLSIIYLCDPEALTEERIEKLKNDIVAGGKYQELRKTICQRLDEHMSLKERIDEFVNKSRAKKLTPVRRSENQQNFNADLTNGNGAERSIYDKAWGCCLKELENSMTKATFHKLLQGSTVEYDEGSHALTVLVEREDAKQWLEQKHIGRIQTIADMFFETGVSEVRVKMKA